MKKVSVIVPVYNTEKYLKRCLDSLVKQTLDEVEIIVIEDDSIDDSKKIVKQYEKKYKDKITVIYNKENMGIGYNRNLGIKKATGKFIAFVDSDDYVDDNYLKDMYEEAIKNELDLVVCDLRKVDENYNVIGYDVIRNFEITSLKENPMLILQINLGPANKLFAKELFKDKTARFSEEYKYEDLAVIPKLISSAKRVGKVNNVYYNYVIHAQSQTMTMNEKVFDVLDVLNVVNSYLKELNYYDEIKEYVEFLNIRTIFRYTLQQKRQQDKKVRNEFINRAFEFLNTNFPNWRKNSIYLKRNPLKRLIESSKLLTKIYCSL